jgi:dTDP-4-amino-4,6-dideoxygalactose transaminase
MSSLALHGGDPLCKKSFPEWPVFDQAEEHAVLDALKSGKWGIGGRLVPEFSGRFAGMHDCSYGICVVNGTTALQLALLATGVRPGDEVIVPAYTFVATASAVLAVNAIPIFADIDPDTYTISPDDIAAKATDRTRAVIPVHLAGHPADMTGITDLARKNGIAIIEDCAQAHLSQWQDKSVGTYGDLACFSFQSSKNLTCGEGGIIITNNRELADRCWSYHNCGRTRDGVWYRHPYLGWNYRMTELQAAILLVQLQRLEDQTNLRMQNATRLSRKLAGIKGIDPLLHDERVTRHAYHLYIFRYNSDDFNGIQRSRFLEALNAEGIPASPGYVPLYKEGFIDDALQTTAIQQVAATNLDYSSPACPVTENACSQEAVWLTQNMLLAKPPDIDLIADAINKIQENSDEL